MSRPKQYSSDAERQAAYRERFKEIKSASVLAALPPVPGVANMAAKRRWQELRKSACLSLALLEKEMQAYYDDRSEAWQGSERGENHQSDLDIIDQALSLLSQLDSI